MQNFLFNSAETRNNSKRIVVGRPINGFTITALEFILDDDNEIMRFSDLETAKGYLRQHGYTDDEFDNLWFLLTTDCNDPDSCPIDTLF